jgi:hypothetical protein
MLLGIATAAMALGMLEAAALFNLVNWRQVLTVQLAGRSLNRRYTTEFLLDSRLEFRRPASVTWSGIAAGDIEAKSLMPHSSRAPITFTFDEDGFRNTRRSDKIDVALVGDSFVEGWFVSDHETVARRLEQQSGAAVANLGVAGYGTIQELALIKKWVPELQPKIVVWFYFEGNDLYDDARFEQTFAAKGSGEWALIDGRPVPQDQSWSKRSFLLALLDLLRLYADPIMPNRPAYSGTVRPVKGSGYEVAFADYASVPWSAWVAGRWAHARANIAQAREFCRQHEAHFLLCYVPIKYRVYHRHVEFGSDSACRQWRLWPLRGLCAEFCLDEGIPFLDLTDPLESAVGAGVEPYARMDTHWGASGHFLVAGQVESKLRSLGWLGPEAVAGE